MHRMWHRHCKGTAHSSAVHNMYAAPCFGSVCTACCNFFDKWHTAHMHLQQCVFVYMSKGVCIRDTSSQHKHAQPLSFDLVFISTAGVLMVPSSFKMLQRQHALQVISAHTSFLTRQAHVVCSMPNHEPMLPSISCAMSTMQQVPWSASSPDVVIVINGTKVALSHSPQQC